MQINAASHLIRAARTIGLIGQLREGQRTHQQLCETLSLAAGSSQLLLDALVAIGIIEKYGDDFALSRAGHLLCQYDDDLGDARWDRLVDRLRGDSNREEIADQPQFDYLAATQWAHTSSAIQAAEILNLGGEGEVRGPKILDLGCGSAVWSCAMAHRDSDATIVAVDNQAALQAATATADSIGLSDRFKTIEADPERVTVPDSEFDLVLLAQRLHCLSRDRAQSLLGRAIAAAKPGGRIVIIDLFRGPTKPNLAESLEALKLEIDTRDGQMRSLEETQKQLKALGLERVQFTFLAASRVNMGLAVGVKPDRNS
jgi:ubiquinone/menaquinone biosynthesis C-methylase UbiE